PTKSPRSLTPRMAVALAPGKSKRVNLPLRKMKPCDASCWLPLAPVQNGIPLSSGTQSGRNWNQPTISPWIFTPRGPVACATGKLMATKLAPVWPKTDPVQTAQNMRIKNNEQGLFIPQFPGGEQDGFR